MRFLLSEQSVASNLPCIGPLNSDPNWKDALPTNDANPGLEY